MEWREGECSLRSWRDCCAWDTLLAKSRHSKRAAKSRGRKVKIPPWLAPNLHVAPLPKKEQHLALNRQLRRLRRVWVSFLFFVLIPSRFLLSISHHFVNPAPPASKAIILEYKQSLVFLSLSSKTRETRKWPRGWLKARDRRGTFLASLYCVSRTRALASLNRKEKRDCPQSLIIQNQGNYCFWNPESWAWESLI